MPLTQPAAVFRCDNVGCDAISILEEPVLGAHPRLPNGWFRISTSAPNTEPYVLCSTSCLRSKACQLAEPPF